MCQPDARHSGVTERPRVSKNPTDHDRVGLIGHMSLIEQLSYLTTPKNFDEPKTRESGQGESDKKGRPTGKKNKGRPKSPPPRATDPAPPQTAGTPAERRGHITNQPAKPERAGRHQREAPRAPSGPATKSDTKTPETPTPALAPIRREDYTPPAGDPKRRIITLGRTVPKTERLSNAATTPATDATKKAIALILEGAKSDEERLGPEEYARRNEEEGRLKRLHQLIFQVQPSQTELADRRALKNKIMEQLIAIFGRDGLSTLKMPNFLREIGK